uniref:Uncharacterized protein n=1 Tax=Ananas comosus var. bracteatus TaxID=296719 RepID=A0A6V7NSI4_ANACO|nr:unnamed protein product [Ananas comosus var. bracteatus]
MWARDAPAPPPPPSVADRRKHLLPRAGRTRPPPALLSPKPSTGRTGPMLSTGWEARASLPAASADSHCRPMRAPALLHQQHPPLAGPPAVRPPPATPLLHLAPVSLCPLNFVSLVRVPQWPAVLRKVSTTSGTLRPVSGCLWITSGLIVQGPKPLRESKSDFRCVSRRNPPTERGFGLELFRWCFVMDCLIAEPCWLVTRCALRGSDCRLVADGWLLSILASIATARTHFTNTSGLATARGCSFPEKWLEVPTREPGCFMRGLYAFRPGCYMRGSYTFRTRVLYARVTYRLSSCGTGLRSTDR